MFSTIFQRIFNFDSAHEQLGADGPHFLQTLAARGQHWLLGLWVLVLVPYLGVFGALAWGAVVISANLIRHLVEKHNAERDRFLDLDGRVDAFRAMGVACVWASGPVLVALSGGPLAAFTACLLLFSGAVLWAFPYRDDVMKASICLAPFAAAFVVCVTLAPSGTDLLSYLTALPIIWASIATLMYQRAKLVAALGQARAKEDYIEELEARVRAAERASEAKSMFLANMSHEIRTPMNGVLGMAELLTTTRLDSRQRTYADTIQKSGTALLRIINDILDFSKIEAGKVELEEAPFNLRGALDDIAALMSPAAQEKGIEVLVRYQPGLPEMVVGDCGRFRQVVTNLVGNGIKFTEQGHVLINVEGYAEKGEVALRVAVSDTGIGIAEDRLHHIFEAFQQADISTEREFGGTGLGLSISQHLIALMGGKLQVSSAPKKGSTFWFSVALPISDASAPVGQADMPPDLHSSRVLIVDDVAINRQILAEQLSSWGFRTKTVPNGPEALSQMRQASLEADPFKLIMLDNVMPEMDGWELARAIDDDNAIAPMRKIMLTSQDIRDDEQKASAYNLSAHLVKPAPATLVYETVVDVLRDAAAPSGGDASTPMPTAPSITTDAATPSAPVLDNRLRVLLADDNEVNRMVVRHMTNADLVDLVEAKNGAEAVDAFKGADTPFDMVLMDVSMPVLDGYEATQQIRVFEQDRELNSTPIICLTAHAMESDIQKSRENGMDDFLSKPITQAKLDAILDRWRPAAQRAVNQ